MASDALMTLLEESRRDPALAKALAGAATVEDAARIAAEHGIDVTVADLSPAGDEVGDADLAAVSGGVVDQIWPTAPWVAC